MRFGPPPPPLPPVATPDLASALSTLAAAFADVLSAAAADISWQSAAALAASLCCVYLLGAVLLSEPTPRVDVPVDEDVEPKIDGSTAKFDAALLTAEGARREPSVVYCWDPSSMDMLGTLPVASAEDVAAAVGRARVAQAAWAGSTWGARRRLLRTMLRFVTENQRAIARVAVRESGKTMVDAIFGEILVTCEKLKWTIAHGEAALRPERRPTGTLAMTKRAWLRPGPVGDPSRNLP